MDLKAIRDLSLKILLDSIRYKTVLGDQYGDIVDYYKEVLSQHGVHVTIHRVPDEYVKKHVPEKFNPWKPRYILIARVGYGDKVLQFNGHYDVVPPGDGWRSDPFNPVISEGRVYGRGSTDMKGGIAAFLSTLIYYAEREPSLVLEGVLVPDEEIGGLAGTGYLVRELGSRPNWVVIAEPSGLERVYNGHRGVAWFIIKVFGKQAHGSAPWLGDNAFEKMLVYASRFIGEYRKLLDAKKSVFNYEDPIAAKPTVNPGGLLISPGAVNIVPGVSGFSIDRRLIVEERADEVVREVRDLASRITSETGIESVVEVLEASNPAYTPESSVIVQSIREAAVKAIGVEPKPVICTGGLDLRYYTEKGVEAVAYGPGVIGLAHQPNEYIVLEDLYRAISVYVKLVEILEGSGRQ